MAAGDAVRVTYQHRAVGIESRVTVSRASAAGGEQQQQKVKS
jgi:hypothetical protein